MKITVLTLSIGAPRPATRDNIALRGPCSARITEGGDRNQTRAVSLESKPIPVVAAADTAFARTASVRCGPLITLANCTPIGRPPELLSWTFSACSDQRQHPRSCEGKRTPSAGSATVRAPVPRGSDRPDHATRLSQAVAIVGRNIDGRCGRRQARGVTGRAWRVCGRFTGETCPNAMGRGRRSTSSSAAGA